MGRDLIDRPWVPLDDLALQIELLRHALAGLDRREPGDCSQTGEPEEAEPFLARRREVRRRRTQHQPRGTPPMPAPDELGDWPTHRIADGDELLDAQHVAQPDGIVGAVLQPEEL